MKKQLVRVELLLDPSLIDRVYKFAISNQDIIAKIDQQELIESDLGHAAMLQIVSQMHEAALAEAAKKEVAA